MRRRAKKFELSEETRALIRRGLETQVGDVLSYAELDRIIGADSRLNRHLLYRAFHCLTRDHGIVFGCVEGAGYRHLSAEETVGVVMDCIPKIHRATRRARRKARVAQESYSALSREKQVELNAAQAMLGSLAHCSAPQFVRASKKHCNDNPPVFPDNMEVFSKS